MSKGVRISEKYGVNPTIPVCFWCGKERNEIALLGQLPKDAEAPIYSVIDYEPCEECEAGWKKGIAIFEVRNSANDQPAWHGAYPTGRMVVIRPSALPEEFRKHPRIFMVKKDFETCFSVGNKN